MMGSRKDREAVFRVDADLVFLVCKFVFVDLEFIGLWSFSGADIR